LSFSTTTLTLKKKVETMIKESKQKTSLSVPQEIPLPCDIQDLSGEVIVQRGELFSSQLLRKIAQGGPRAKPALSMRDFSTLWQDINHVFNEFPLKDLFQGKGLKGHLKEALLETTIPTLVIEVLRYFRDKDPYTYWHSLRVFVLTAHTALNLLSDLEEGRLVASMGPLHDLGKISVPLEILQKDTPLTMEERNRIKYHVLVGSILLSYYQGHLDKLGPHVTLEHHERRNGSGYPFGMALSDRKIEIVAVCDVYDALISPRPYRNRPYDFRTCLEVLTQKALNGQFSPDIVNFIIALHRKGNVNYQTLTPSLETRGTPPEQNNYGQVLMSPS
jgi:HD-GYP domain-containing protein (c-di-GMP phosphodiesterase class II)